MSDFWDCKSKIIILNKKSDSFFTEAVRFFYYFWNIGRQLISRLYPDYISTLRNMSVLSAVGAGEGRLSHGQHFLEILIPPIVNS